MPSRVVATDSEAKINSGSPGAIQTKGSKVDPDADVIASTPTQDKVDTPTLPSDEAPRKGEQPKITLPSPVPSTPGDHIAPQPGPEQGREGYFDQVSEGSASQFLQILGDLQNQFQGKLSDQVEARDEESDQRSAAMNRATENTRQNMRANEEVRGKEYAEFIGEERSKADTRQKEWTDHETKMSESRQLINDFYNNERVAAENRANEWFKFIEQENAKALTRGTQWDTFMTGETDKATQRQSMFDNALKTINEQSASRMAQLDEIFNKRQGGFNSGANNGWVRSASGQMYDPRTGRMANGKIPFRMVRGRKIKDPVAKAIANGKRKHNPNFFL